jgi:hypothetical protein
MPVLVLCATEVDDPQLERYAAAADRHGLTTIVAVPGRMAPAPGTSVGGVIAARRGAVTAAAALAQTCGVPWHDPHAVRLCGDRLHLLGRLTAAGIPVPRFTAVDAASGEGLERIQGIPAPWRVTDPSTRLSAVVDTVDALEAQATAWRRGSTAPDSVGALVVEPVVETPGWMLVGLLDAGALRVVAIVDAADAGAAGGGRRLQSPTSLARDAQAHLAGLVSQACACVGLQQGPVVAAAASVDGRACLVEVCPGALEAPSSDVVAVVGPGMAPCTLDDLVVRHAAGEAIDGYALDGRTRTVRLET